MQIESAKTKIEELNREVIVLETENNVTRKRIED